MIPLLRWYTVLLFPVTAALFARSQDVQKPDPSLDRIFRRMRLWNVLLRVSTMARRARLDS